MESSHIDKELSELAGETDRCNGSLMTDTSFPCSANHDAKILILGSMPGQISLKQQQYYAHPRNAFWPIMGQLGGFSAELPYQQRLELLCENHVALWDVAYQCVRPGSLDSAIQTRSVVANDFETFFSTHNEIQTVCFNGKKAYELFRKLVLPNLSESFAELPRIDLPSTSPAHAAMSFEQKLEKWQQIKDFS